jgi:hypothetical protein
MHNNIYEFRKQKTIYNLKRREYVITGQTCGDWTTRVRHGGLHSQLLIERVGAKNPGNQ